MELHLFAIVLLLCYKGSLGHELIKVIDTNTSLFVELLRGRDGLTGRDGPQGPVGPRGSPGRDGKDCTPATQIGGATYIRWGKSSCPGVTGTELVYEGYAAGSHYSHKGGGSNYLCMPRDPVYSSTLEYYSGVASYADTIHGAEYENPIQGTHNHNAPCAVCRVSTRPTVVMIPAKDSCPITWTKEYYGYLMSEHKIHHRTTFVCMDKAMESRPGTYGNSDGTLLYHTEVSCTTNLPCPPYDNQKELNCVVCTK